MDLVDALSKSGLLSFDNWFLFFLSFSFYLSITLLGIISQMHLLIANTLCFDQSLLHTVARANINPIDQADAVMDLIQSVLLL